MANYPHDLPRLEYDKLWAAYKKYVLSDPLTRIDPPTKRRWDELEKSFKRTPIRLIYSNLEDKNITVESKVNKMKKLTPLQESGLRKIVRKLSEEQNTEYPSPVKKFQQLSGLEPTKTISKSYPYEFTIGKRYTLIVSKDGKFILTFKGGNDYIWQHNSAQAAYKALVQGNDI